MEYNLSTILGKLIGTGDDLLSATITENNTLSKNLELLKKVNIIRGFREEYIKNLHKKIAKVRSDRNLFIHGIGGQPQKHGNDIIIYCDERKTKYNGDVLEGKTKSKSWSFNKGHYIKLLYIKRQINWLEDIVAS